MNSVLDYLEDSARKFPDKTAFADMESSCSFEELERDAKIIGTELAKRQISGRPVPVMMEKSVKTIKVMMGVVYAGGCYVILDASHPVHRLNQILETLCAREMIVEENSLPIARQLSFDGTLISAETLNEGERDDGVLEKIRKKHCDRNPLYILFTSGSTGTPKGVVVGHQSVIDFIDCFTEIFGIGSSDVLGNQAPWDFDVSVKDIYSGLKTGATVQIIPKKLFSIPKMLLDFLDERHVTNLTWAVSAMCIISTLKGFTYKVPSALKRVMFSGEVMPIRHLNYWRSHLPDTMFVNLYGPTEITCNCTYYIIDREFAPGEALPIGKAFPNEKVFLLDEENREVVEQGQKGEICVSGTALALGYYNNPEQTGKAFVQNPLNSSYLEPVYRTGDLAFYNEEGNLCFASRKDFQIKHMGHRIELGEIESALERVDGVARSICFFDTQKNKIVCFYQGEADKRQICTGLKEFLPDYMIPNIFRRIDALPLTKNGKIDRQKLMASYYEART